MANYTKQEIMDLVKDNDVRFIRLQFTDMFGVLKNVAIPSSQLTRVLNSGCMFDGSSIDGFARIEESDMHLVPDLNTFVIFPWRPQQGRVARIICDVYKTDGTAFEGCPRNILKNVLKEASDMGYTLNVGPECEFFLFATDSEGAPTSITHDEGGYFDMAPVDRGEDCRREIVLTLENMGFEIEASHHEVAQGQHEIDFKYDDALTTADNIMTFKLVVKTIAQKHGLYASFMPKPIFGINGSGMHANQSLSKDGVNAFFDETDELQLSPDAYSYIAGLMQNVKAIAAVTNPLVNSYKRLVPGYEAPVYIAWSAKNRSPLIRIPAARGAGTRVELRCPDPSCNPYLAIALMLAAGLKGIKEKLTPPPAVNKNIFAMTADERAAEGIGNLPGSLMDAVDEMKANPLVREVLGDHVFDLYTAEKENEWNKYRLTVHQWELDNYLAKF